QIGEECTICDNKITALEQVDRQEVHFQSPITLSALSNEVINVQFREAGNLIEYYKNRTLKQRDLIERATREISNLNELKRENSSLKCEIQSLKDRLAYVYNSKPSFTIDSSNNDKYVSNYKTKLKPAFFSTSKMNNVNRTNTLMNYGVSTKRKDLSNSVSSRSSSFTLPQFNDQIKLIPGSRKKISSDREIINKRHPERSVSQLSKFTSKIGFEQDIISIDDDSNGTKSKPNYDKGSTSNRLSSFSFNGRDDMSNSAISSLAKYQRSTHDKKVKNTNNGI
ncbi:hypothetical protein E3Q00_03228, partial [Wallemia mellicola]